MRRRAGAGTAAALLCAVATACGTPSADLFVVDRSGELPGAKLNLVVGDGGAVECDGAERAMTSQQLLDARELLRDMTPLLERHLDLPPGPQSLLHFKVTGEDGTLAFYDSSPGRPPALSRLLAFVRAVAMQSCGRPR